MYQKMKLLRRITVVWNILNQVWMKTVNVLVWIWKVGSLLFDKRMSSMPGYQLRQTRHMIAVVLFLIPGNQAGRYKTFESTAKILHSVVQSLHWQWWHCKSKHNVWSALNLWYSKWVGSSGLTSIAPAAPQNLRHFTVRRSGVYSTNKRDHFPIEEPKNRVSLKPDIKYA